MSKQHKNINKDGQMVEEPVKTANEADGGVQAPDSEAQSCTAVRESAEFLELNDKYLRLMAEFDNFRKRTQREKEQLSTEIKALCVLNILPVLDNLERAQVSSGDYESLREGIDLVLKQFEGTLEKMGVSEIEAEGKDFDPEKHNAVMHEEDEELPPSTVKEVLQKGYEVSGRVIRHAIVKVAN